MNSSATDLVRDLGGEIRTIVSELAKGLGVAAEHVYVVMIKQQIVSGIANLTWWIIPLILLIYFIRLVNRKLIQPIRENSCDYSESASGGAYFLIVLLYAALAAILIATMVTLYTGIGKLVNSEYYVLRNIVDMIDQMRNGSGT